MVVEDSMLYRKAIIKYLKKHLPEKEFMIAKDGKKGYEKYNPEKPDFLILDLLMPKMKGGNY